MEKLIVLEEGDLATAIEHPLHLFHQGEEIEFTGKIIEGTVDGTLYVFKSLERDFKQELVEGEFELNVTRTL